MTTKRWVYAVVKLSNTFQVELEVDTASTKEEMDRQALEVALIEWGDFDEGEVMEMDWLTNPPKEQ